MQGLEKPTNRITCLPSIAHKSSSASWWRNKSTCCTWSSYIMFYIYIYINKLYRKTISCKISRWFHGWSQFADRTHLEPWCMHVCGWQTLGTLEQFSQLISVKVMNFGRFFFEENNPGSQQYSYISGRASPARMGGRFIMTRTKAGIAWRSKKTNSKTPPWKIRDFQEWKDRILSNHGFSEVNC